MKGKIKERQKFSHKIPDLSILFFFGTIFIIIASYFFSKFHISAINPLNKESVFVHNLLNKEDFLNFIGRLGGNFLGFSALFPVFFITMAVGILDGSGLLQIILRQSVFIIPKRLTSPFLAMFSIFLHVTSYAAYVFLIPLAAMFFYLRGRHPLAGITLSFAGVAGGFVANFTPTMSDPLMQALTEKAAKLFDASYDVSVLAGYFYSVASAVGLVFVLSVFNDYVMEPIFHRLFPFEKIKEEEIKTIDSLEKKALYFASSVWILMLIFFLIASFLFPTFLHDGQGHWFSKGSFFVQFIIPLLFIFLALPGYVYGVIVGVFRSSKSLIASMSKAIAGISGFLVFIFFVTQFLDVLKTSNFVLLFVLWGASLLQSLSTVPAVLIIGFFLFTILFNFIVPSEIAKWSILAPFVVPMFMQLGIAPELTQSVYRIGDSAGNVVTPLFVFYPFVLEHCKRYVSSFEMTDLLVFMTPYSLILSLAMFLFLFLFWLLNIPIGVDSSFVYPK